MRNINKLNELTENKTKDVGRQKALRYFIIRLQIALFEDYAMPPSYILRDQLGHEIN